MVEARQPPAKTGPFGRVEAFQKSSPDFFRCRRCEAAAYCGEFTALVEETANNP
jgi:hypothetical protein